jgi:branched-chain amino acid transport system permease protein
LEIKNMISLKTVVFLVILIMLILLPFLSSGYFVSLIASIFAAGTLAGSWNLISGFTGYVSFGHQAFFGIGAYATAILVTSLHLGEGSLFYSILFGGIVAAAVALVFGYPAFILRGPYFSILTLGFSEFLYVIMVNTPWFGGGEGLTLPPVYVLPQYYMITLVLFIVSFILLYWMRQSKFGFALATIRQDEDAAESSGVHTFRYKMIAFTVSAFFTGLIGGAYVWYITYIDAVAAFDPHVVVQMIAITMFGGLGTVVGPMIGAFCFVILSEFLWSSMPELYLVVLGVTIVFIIEFFPRGVVVHAMEALKIKVV